MNRVVAAMATAVRTAPAVVMVSVLVLTVGLGYLASQVQLASGNEGFAPDNPEIAAVETLAERFGSAGEDVVQILLETESGGNLITADGLAAIAEIEEALRDDPMVAEQLADAEMRPAIVSPLHPVIGALAEAGDPAQVDDDTVAATLLDVLASMPPVEAQGVTGLLPSDADLDAGVSDALLALVFLSTDGLPEAGSDRFDALIEIESAVVAAAQGAEIADDVEVSGMSFALLFADDGAFEAEITRLFGAAFVVILLILATVYWLRPGAALTPLRSTRRTFADVGLTMLTIVMAILWMNGAATLLGPDYLDVIGPLTEMTQIIPVLLIGLGVDFAIHLTSRYREEVGQGIEVEAAITRAIRTVGVALVLATVTTAVGFLTNIVNPMPALRDFGVLAAVGITAAFVLMLTFVPAARMLLDRRAERAGRLPRAELLRTSERFLPEIMARTAGFAERIPVVTLIVTVALGGALGMWGLSRLDTQFSSTDFVPDDAPILTTLETIEERFDGGFGETTEVLITGDVDRPEVHNALVGAVDALREVDGVSVTAGRAEVESPLSALGQLVAPGPEGAPLAPAVAERAEQAGLSDDLAVATGADVAGLYRAMLDGRPDIAGRVLDLDGDVEAARLALRTTAGEAGAAQLATDLDAVFAPVAALGVDVVVTSNPIINAVIISALQDSQLASLAITLGAAMFLLMLTFHLRDRRPALGVITTLPVILAVLWTFAMMAATGIPFGPVTATIAALTVGIGVPYSIHVTNRYQEDRLRYPPDEAIRSTVRHTGGALAGSALTTCAGFGILVTSSLTPFRQFGLVTVYAIGFALLAATFVLPSALTLWDAWHRRRRRSGREVTVGSPAPEDPEPAVVG
jgi:uncharacterized protein